ncbi:tubulin binding cofactor A-domain-containing protein [Fomitopsis serialis]|uniref:tubulin binding cofactor A-domain-containing protein n=1 Tax=Fomitopsis serialis TaxID=139415 RepID=UPI002007C5E4|nr:tubulin binding cofactor A-domain-containing protein [Neoantrodia serialis]KAH9929691.1 tubulin binding cofactor A-domain-containing protein [Neoantrodia serialis]
MSDVAALRRQLKIKTGSAKRLYKEHKSYQKEEEDLTRKLNKFIADNAEDWDIKNTRRMLEESQRMIHDTSNRLGTTVQDLREVTVAAEKVPELHADPELIAAQETLETVSI